MKRLLLNGSPRGKASNSRLLLAWLNEGMSGAGMKEEPAILDLAAVKELDAQRQAFLEADEVVLAFPLYTDSMPGVVKNFIECLADADAKDLKGKRMAYIIQSGFSESIHSETVAAYCERLSRRLGFIHAGTLVKGAVEGIRFMTDRMTAKLKANLVRAGGELVSDGRFSEALAHSMAKPRKLSPAVSLLFRIAALTGVTNFYWNMMLKKHKAYERRFDAPYGPRATAP